nr:unnamed protein product [Callosobruchus analis]
MISLITHPNGLRFSNVYLYCNPHTNRNINTYATCCNRWKDIGYFEYTEEKDIIPPQPHETQFSHHF